jgi:hypothetical protein
VLTVVPEDAWVMSLMIDTTGLSPNVPKTLDPSLHTVTSPHRSSAREKVLEYRFLADLTAELFLRDMGFDVLRSDVDALGHGLVIEANGVIRHIQLKVMYRGGKRTANIHLAARPSGCIVWMIYDPVTLGLVSFRWFGGAPGERLPDIGARVAKHGKCNAMGVKTDRPAHRVIPGRYFTTLPDVSTLTDRMFGSVTCVD